MGEIIYESLTVEAKIDGPPMDANELRLAQMGTSVHTLIWRCWCRSQLRLWLSPQSSEPNPGEISPDDIPREISPGYKDW
jgi:hypothetical protein